VQNRLTPGPTALAAAPTVLAAAPTVLAAAPTALASAPNGLAAATPVVAAATAAPVAVRGTSGEVALTFDAGADRGYAEDILDILQEQHVLASFGITGVWARANPELVRRMAADGHLVFNHTLDHRSFTGVSDKLGGLSPTRRRAELDDADAIIAPLLGHTTKPWYRLPYGDDDAQVAADLAPDGYTHKLGWTVDSLGWRGSPSADIVARCLKLAAPGGIYVFHVGRASQDAIALPQIIAGLRDKGFGFRRADQA
jgi:peptidoglycan/xylan/chitin deacetylase (PgdA/CDA1 family)